MCALAAAVERVPTCEWVLGGCADFGNFQDAEGKQKEKAERLRFGRFFYRFPNGESGADVYDRMTIFEDHLIRRACLGPCTQRFFQPVLHGSQTSCHLHLLSH